MLHTSFATLIQQWIAEPGFCVAKPGFCVAKPGFCVANCDAIPGKLCLHSSAWSGVLSTVVHGQVCSVRRLNTFRVWKL